MIIEHCYISNAEDAAFISNLENQYKAGAADATGIAQYYGLKKELSVQAAVLTLPEHIQHLYRSSG